MDMKQPTEDMAVPGAIADRIAMLNQQISDKETEVARLNTSITSYTYTNQQLSNEKVELSSQVENLSLQVSKLKEENEIFFAQLTSIKNDIEQVNKEIIEKNTDLKVRQDVVSLEEKNIAEQRGELASARGQLDIDKAQYESDRKALDEKIEKLRAII